MSCGLAIFTDLFETGVYNTLMTETRTELWESFLKKAVITKGEARYSPNKLKRLVEKELNS